MTETRYTPEVAATILDRVSNGETVRKVCLDLGIPVDVSAVVPGRPRRACGEVSPGPRLAG